jgi:alanine racemase
MTASWRPAWAEVDLSAIRANAAELVRLASPAALCAVVKADGYGHGAADVAQAAIDGGAEWLAVALVEEGVALRRAGLDAPVLLLSEPPPDAMPAVVEHGLTPTLYSTKAVEAAAGAARAGAPLPVHVKVDTGMHRVGARPDDAASLARLVHDTPALQLAGLWTHLAVADEPDHPYTAAQLERFEDVRSRLAAAGVVPSLVHAANSAGAIAHPASRYDLVRCGIALYGQAPSAALMGQADLRPALSLKARVSYVKRVPAGAPISYGLRYTAPTETLIATVPLGYADGLVRRSFDVGCEILVGGRRCPLAGTVTMDQVMVDCGPDARVGAGDEVVVIGRQGDEEITAHEWAERLGTISYEVLCGIGPRVPRVYRP